MTDIDDIVQETFDNFIKTKCKKIDNGKYECDSIDIVKVAPMTWKSVRKSDIDEFKLNYRCKKEEQQGTGPGSCGGRKSESEESKVSEKKPSTSEISISLQKLYLNSMKKAEDALLNNGKWTDSDIAESKRISAEYLDYKKKFFRESSAKLVEKYPQLEVSIQKENKVGASEVKEVFDEFKALDTEYPNIFNNLSKIKIGGETVLNGAAAEYNFVQKTLTVSSDALDEIDKSTLKRFEINSRQLVGFHPEGMGTIKGIIDHEIGHYIHNEFIKKDNESVNEIREYIINNKLLEKNLGYGSIDTDDFSMESTYKNTDYLSSDEFIAEIFTSYRNTPPDKQRYFVKDIGKIIDKSIRRGNFLSNTKLNQIAQDVFNHNIKLNYRCKKEEQQGEGPGSCGGKKSVPKEKAISVKKPRSVSKQIVPKAKRSTKNKPVAQKVPQDLDSILKMPGDMDTFYSTMEKHMSKLSANELIEISKKYERAMRAPGYEKIPYEEYSRMSLTYVTAKDMAKDAKLSKPKVQNVEIKSIDDAKKVLGVEDVWHDGNKPKASVIKSLNVIAKEHTRLLQDYPNLQRVNIKFMNFPDEGMARDGINGHYLMNSISMSSKLPMSERETRSLDGGVLMRGVGISGTYRHEFGHAVEDQLFTKEERDGISRLWNKLEDDDNKSGGFGSNSMKKQVGYTVSEYAIKNSMELVAEMFCEMAKGKTYPDTFCPEVQAPIKRVLFGGK